MHFVAHDNLVLSTYSVSEMIVNEFDITSYVSTVVSLILGCGLLFQFPVVVYFLTKIGMITPQLMRKSAGMLLWELLFWAR